VVLACEKGWDPIGGATLGWRSEGSSCTVAALTFADLRAAVWSLFGVVEFGGFVPFWCQLWWSMRAMKVWLGLPPNLGWIGILFP
jgi:hypothetical protein